MFLLAGCEKTDQIAEYTVPSHDSIQSAEFRDQAEKFHPKPNRMIGVVIPQSEFQWFFKLEGEPAVVAAREADLRSFLQTVRFPSPENIDWTLPNGWRRLPGSPMRYSTILLDGQPTLEMSVTRLPTQTDSPPMEQVLMNINRWRNQLSLPPIELDDLPYQSEKISFGSDGAIAYWINIVGRPRSRPAGMNRPTRQPDAPNPPKYDKPGEWVEGKPNGVAVVSLQVEDGGEKAGITITPAGGNQLDNVNRWRKQLGLDPVGKDELARNAQQVVVGSQTGQLFEISNDDLTIFGVIVDVQGQSWFIKLVGNKGLADRERPRFVEFLNSLKWN